MSPVTVIMRTKNSADTVAQALKSLYSQCYHNFQLYIVDSGSTDSTLSIVHDYPCRLSSIAPQDYFPATVLNNSIEQNSSPIIVFWNSDSIATSRGCLRQLIQPFADPEVQATFGRQIARPDAELWVKRDYNICFPNSGQPPSYIPYSLPIAAMRRSAWKKHPFYDGAWGSEDTEWGTWAQREGLKIRYVPQAEVIHSHNYTPRQLYARRYIEGEADAFIYSTKHTLFKALGQWTLGCVRDLALYLRHRELCGLASIPLRQWAGVWGYHKGNHWGNLRRKADLNDREKGQKIILSNR